MSLISQVFIKCNTTSYLNNCKSLSMWICHKTSIPHRNLNSLAFELFAFATMWLPTQNRISLLYVFHALFYWWSGNLQGIYFLNRFRQNVINMAHHFRYHQKKPKCSSQDSFAYYESLVPKKSVLSSNGICAPTLFGKALWCMAFVMLRYLSPVSTVCWECLKPWPTIRRALAKNTFALLKCHSAKASLDYNQVPTVQ